MPLKTALFHEHTNEGARIVDFAGWDMPIQYDSITAEHKAVREGCGMFDVSHMGRFYIKGSGAAEAIDRIVACRVTDMYPGKVRYTVVCNEKGGIRDDILVTRFSEDLFFLVVNASNREKLFGWFGEHLGNGVELTDHTMETGMIAVQGPDAQKITAQLVDTDVETIDYYHARQLDGGRIVSRTGYTGEDGFEVIAPNAAIAGVWKKARQAGAKPAGLGARDSLRLEVGYPLYGHELEEDITPLEAGLAWVLNLDKDEFIGQPPLLQQKKEGIPRRRIGFVLDDKGIPRQGYALFDGETEIGAVTSGGFSHVLNKGVGLALVKAEHAKPQSLSVDIRGKKIPASVQKPPFVEKGVKA